MATELHRFSDAYASVQVALYEPLVLRWVSGLQLRSLATDLVRQAAARDQRVAQQRAAEAPPAPGGSFYRILLGWLGGGDGQRSDAPPSLKVVRSARRDGQQPISSGLADMVYSGVVPSSSAVTTIVSSAALAGLTRPMNQRARALSVSMLDAAKLWAASEERSLAPALSRTIVDLSAINAALLAERVEEALSPIGLVRFYRQLFFHVEEGVGPIEQAFTIAPLESLEIVYESTRRQVHEEEVEIGSESVSEAATEEKNTDEISDKVSSMMQRDLSVGLNVAGGGGIGFVYGSGSANVNFALQSQDAREQISKRVTEVTRRASERIRRTFTLRTRDTTELTQHEITRRVIRNESSEPVSYGLRRVLRKVKVKIQEIGPALVWQINVATPGDRLALSQYLQFLPQDRIEVPEMAVQPRGGTGRGTAVLAVEGADRTGGLGSITISFGAPGSQRVRAVTVERLSDVGGTPNDDEPSIVGSNATSIVHNDADNITSATFTVRRGDRAQVSVEYSYVYEPSESALRDYGAQMRRAQEAGAEQVVARGLERARLLITERSKIVSRPSADLRREERYEILSRILAELGEDGGPGTTPLEIELFNRYFDVDGMFHALHPAWWRPRWQNPDERGYGRADYQVTADSAPAAMGSSLGWKLQLDGDARRNEFLNAPFVRACLPIRRGREREALDWLAHRLEGDAGFSDGGGHVPRMLGEIEAFRGRERQVPSPGYDYVELSSIPGAGQEGGVRPTDIYPIINEFDVVVPTDGFVYDRLSVVA